MAVWNEVSLSALELRRIDPEFYKPEYVKAKSIAGEKRLKSYGAVVLHPAEFTRRYSQDGLLILLAQNNRDNYYDWEVRRFVSPELWDIISRNRLEVGDVTITRSGANYGQTSVVGTEIEDNEIFACADLLLLRTSAIDGYLLSTYFNSAVGKKLLARGAYGAAQPHIAPKYIREIPFPEYLVDHGEEIRDLIIQSRNCSKRNELLVSEARCHIESELGLDKLKFKKPVGYTARFSELEQSRRLDPEPFYPAFEHLVKHLPTSVTLTPLFKLIHPCQTGVQPTYSEKGTVPVINSRHVLCNKIDHGNCRRAFEIDRTAMAQPEDVLLNATGAGTLGRASALLTDSGRIFDVCIVRIRPHSIDPVYLAAFLNTIAGQLQVERHTRGSSGQLHLYPRDVSKIQVWNAPKSFQSKVRRLIEEAHKAEKDANQFLAEAKTRVEQLIEEAVRE